MTGPDWIAVVWLGLCVTVALASLVCFFRHNPEQIREIPLLVISWIVVTFIIWAFPRVMKL